MVRRTPLPGAVLMAAFVGLACGGCHTCKPGYSPPLLKPCARVPACRNEPRELAKMAFPDYVIEPPDVLVIDAVRVVPLPPYRIEPLDVLALMVTETLPEQPIQGMYSVEPDGRVNLGFTYGSVQVADKTVEEARAAIDAHLRAVLKPGYQLTVSPAETRARQQINGQHLVRQDGKVGLGIYGGVPVAGLTIEQAKAAIEAHLSVYLLKPEVSVDVAGFNSKVYYVITDNLGANDAVYRLPTTGNETVLDALSQINGMPLVASKERIWVARPCPTSGGDKILPVDWVAVTRGGRPETNYQILPGDRIYVQSQPILTFDSYLAKFLAPVERIFGITLLGTTTIQTIRGENNFVQ